MKNDGWNKKKKTKWMDRWVEGWEQTDAIINGRIEKKWMDGL